MIKSFIKTSLRYITFPFFMKRVEEAYHPREYKKTNTEVDKWIEGVEEKGYHIVENFFSKDELKSLQEEANRFDELIENDNFPKSDKAYFSKIKKSFRIFHTEEVSDKIKNIFSNNELFTLLLDTYYGRKDNFVWTMYQKSKFDRGDDPNTGYGVGWHIDNYRRSLKIFIYLNDVEIENGPFLYLPNSNQLDDLKMKYLKNSFLKDNNHNERYLTRDDLKKYKVYDNALPLTAKAGTIIFAETRGWHSAGLVTSGERKVLVNYYHKPYVKAWRIFNNYLSYEV